MHKAKTFGELKANGYKPVPVKEEIRNNLIRKLQQREPLFSGIIGYEDTVIPAVINALLAKHDMILLGLRGQAKTRLARLIPSLLDEYIPVVAGSEVNDSPFAPISKAARDLVESSGDDTPIEWIHRESRYGEKLATPDVTIADLIGDIDPIKAATLRLHYAHEGAIHYGIIPRTNRGVFAINELPDLQPRIQVGLFNILQEKDIQIRGFNVRIPLDVLMIFTANPEDYTNRGSIITPLKDRIESQILTHYPRTVEEGMTITAQEAWVHRDGREVVLPEYFKKIVEEIAFQARASEFVDQKSGVSARLPISVTENLISNAERRAILLNDNSIVPRITDLTAVLPGITGKIELVFEGEQEGTIKVAKALVGKAVREVFKEYFPDPLQKPRRNQRQGTATQQQSAPENEYAKIISWFESGNTITLEDTMPLDAYVKELDRVKGLRELTGKYMKTGNNKYEMASAMEFVLDALHQNSRIAKNELNGNGKIEYKDLIGSIFAPREEDEYEDN